jgi:hypothetical protein
MKNVTYLLENFDSKELSILYKLLNIQENNILQILDKLGELLLPLGGYFQKPLNYTDFLKKIASHNNMSISCENGNIEAEQQLFLTLFKKEFDKMSDSEKEDYLKKTHADGLNKNQIASLTAITTLGAAQASGFGIYLLATTTIGAISSTLGITLPFALYSTMSSAISLIIGPVGFLVMGVAVYKSFKDVKNIDEISEKFSLAYKSIKKGIFGDYERATICFKYIAAMRTVIPVRFENEINQQKAKLLDYETQKNEIALEINENNLQISSSKEEITIHNNQIQELHYKIEDLKTQVQKEKYEIFNIQLNIAKFENDNFDLRNDIDINENTSFSTKVSLTEMEDKLQEFLMKTKNQL